MNFGSRSLSFSAVPLSLLWQPRIISLAPHRSHDVPICCSMSPDHPAAPSVCTALLPRSPRRPLSTTFCGQKQQASISLSFSLFRRFPHLGISSPYRAKLRPGLLYITKSPDAFTPRFLTDLRRNSLTFYFQNHQYQFRKCILLTLKLFYHFFLLDTILCSYIIACFIAKISALYSVFLLQHIHFGKKLVSLLFYSKKTPFLSRKPAKGRVLNSSSCCRTNHSMFVPAKPVPAVIQHATSSTFERKNAISSSQRST